ncbi:hypothetical protein BXQ17_13980 [Polaribacter sp. BM10]|uniref:nucleotidyltransferase family protein n=1 Tax=Polaribacter sp. BM10 TaxID=1529069 RepID=UPI00098B0249|nr:nucleotidyltransferase family protein [Polaribacter sp. BM10]AQS95117.1 hypothetical protein BXQ17_13980 [Polaribacter sp. BM10]
MNYKETLFFIGKCLTITDNHENQIFIEKEIKFKKVNWESVVKVSSTHLVIPAMYIKLKEMELLKFLEKDLVFFLEDITNLNRQRNIKIIKQAKQINTVLLKNNVTPIFIKGTAYLLNNLYKDVAERMVGDIDFIVRKEDYLKTVEILKKNDYSKLSYLENPFPHTRHHSRLVKHKEIAAVEVHDELTSEKFFKEYNYNSVSNDLIVNNNNEYFLNYQNQLCLSIISNQINDKAYVLKSINLRNAYDIYLLSFKTNTLEAISNIEKLKTLLNSYLAICHITLGKPKEILWKNDKKTKKYLKKFINRIEQKSKFKYKLLKVLLKYETKIKIIKKIFTDRRMRKWFFEITTNKEWLKRKTSFLIQKKNV